MKEESKLNKMPSEDIIRKINEAVVSGCLVDLGNGTEVYAEANRVSFSAQITGDTPGIALKKTVYMEDNSFFETVKMLNEYQIFYETYCDIMGSELHTKLKLRCFLLQPLLHCLTKRLFSVLHRVHKRISSASSQPTIRI